MFTCGSLVGQSYVISARICPLRFIQCMAGFAPCTVSVKSAYKTVPLLNCSIVSFCNVTPEEFLARGKITDFDHGLSDSDVTHQTPCITTKSYFSLLYPSRHPIRGFDWGVGHGYRDNCSVEYTSNHRTRSGNAPCRSRLWTAIV